MKRLCTICARHGSKGVKSKNIRELLGKPLIAHSILQAKASGLFEAVAVSSDSREILEISAQWGADCLIERPAAMATDQAPKVPAMRHCWQKTEEMRGAFYEVIVDLDATSPLRGVDDIRGAVKLLEECGAGNVITAAPAHRSPYFNLVELDEAGRVRISKPPTQPVFSRQEAPPCFDMNASIYVWTRDALSTAEGALNQDTRLYCMPSERSFDIDSELDFEIVKCLALRRGELL
jgi:CMP-N,N'-diacetyllegionaminic acid synthase